jgi:hypothetical protein
LAWAPEFEPAENVDEADAVRWHTSSFGGVDHHESNGVVDNAEHGEFSLHSIDGLAAQNVHPHRGLEMIQIRLDLPSVTVEFGNSLLGISIGIEQRRDDRHLS